MNIEWDTEYHDFIKEAEARMKDGAKEYGNQSFTRDPQLLLGEIEEELMDVANWSFILYCRLQKMRQALAGVDLDDDLQEWSPSEADPSQH